MNHGGITPHGEYSRCHCVLPEVLDASKVPAFTTSFQPLRNGVSGGGSPGSNGQFMDPGPPIIIGPGLKMSSLICGNFSSIYTLGSPAMQRRSSRHQFAIQTARMPRMSGGVWP